MKDEEPNSALANDYPLATLKSKLAEELWPLIPFITDYQISDSQLIDLTCYFPASIKMDIDFEQVFERYGFKHCQQKADYTDDWIGINRIRTFNGVSVRVHR